MYIVLGLFAALNLHAQSPNCQIQTIGGSPATFGPDGTAALQTRLAAVNGMAVDQSGALYFSDSTNHRVRMITAAGVVMTVAGSGAPGFSGDGGPATTAQLNRPGALAFDSKGNLYVADTKNYRIRMISPAGTISTFAGSGATGDIGDGGSPTNAGFESLADLAVGPDDSLYVADSSAWRVRKITAGKIVAFAGSGIPLSGSGTVTDGAAAAQTVLLSPTGIAVNTAGDVFIANGGIFKVTPAGIISTVAGGGGSAADGLAASSTRMNAVKLAFDASGNLDFYDSNPGISVPLGGGVFSVASAVRLVDAGGIVRHVATLNAVTALAFSRRGLLAAAGGQVQMVTATDSLTPLAGMPDIGFTGDGGPATSATVAGLTGVAVSSSGSVYFSDSLDARVRRIDSNGIISTFAGSGPGGAGRAGDNGPATSASLTAPAGLAIDAAGNVYIADVNSGVVRRVDTEGVITTVAGGGPNPVQFSAIPALSAKLPGPYQVSLDSAGNLFILDSSHTIKKVSSADQTISLVAAGGVETNTGAGFQSWFTAMTVDPHDNLFAVYAPSGSPATITKVAPDGQLTTVNWVSLPNVTPPTTIAVDSAGFIYLASSALLRKYEPDGTLVTLGGSSTGVDILQDGPPSLTFEGASEIALAADNSLYLADTWYQRIRKLTAAGCATVAQPAIAAVVNAASLTGGFAAGEIVSLFGVWMGPSAGAAGQIDSSGKLQTSVGGVSVLVNGQPVPIYYAAAGQINAEIPQAAAQNSFMAVQVQYSGLVSDRYPLYFENASPGIFGSMDRNGRVAAILNADGAINSALNPAARGSYVEMFATGGGLTNPPSADGVPATAASPLVLAATVAVNNTAAEVSYAGAAPTLTGVTQINFQIPSGAAIVTGYNSLTLGSVGSNVTDVSGIYVK